MASSLHGCLSFQPCLHAAQYAGGWASWQAGGVGGGAGLKGYAVLLSHLLLWPTLQTTNPAVVTPQGNAAPAKVTAISSSISISYTWSRSNNSIEQQQQQQQHAAATAAAIEENWESVETVKLATLQQQQKSRIGYSSEDSYVWFPVTP